MPNQDDEQDKNQDSEVVEVPDESEEISDDEQATDEPAETAEDSEPGGELGDQERVMGDGESPKPKGKIKRFFVAYWHHKKWTLPLTLLVIIGILFAVPASRYPLLAMKMKRSFSIAVIDSKTDTPVSGASVTLDGKTVMTDSAGNASLSAKVGKRTVNVSKKYYKDFSESIFVGIARTHNSSKIELQATGRQVPIKVVNKITGKPVANAEIKVLDTEAKTDANGMATIVLPAGSPTQSANITAGGYNNLSGKVQITGKVVSANTFSVTPSGRVYFLSNLSGNIDVVSTNLDGTGRKTVLAGTGNEDQNDTVLLASTDWKYLALLSKRDGGQYAKLFLINTATNQTTTMDEGTASFQPIGWSGHRFVYEVTRENVQEWQPNHYALKSFNADTSAIATLDQTTASGTNTYNSKQQAFVSPLLVGNRVVYVKQWQGDNYNGKQDQILSVGTDGSNKQVLKSITVPANSYRYFGAVVHDPDTVYFQVNTSSIDGTGSSVYYVYAGGNDTLTQSNTVTDDTFQQYQQEATTYLISPTGGQTFWSEQRDGKNTLFVGNYYGNNGKQIATLSDYTSYGWYTDNYLLVEKGGSELYIMPVGGGQALKISDYYKPAQNFNGYGGGYGGL